ncbi:DUF4897 domain-containing protein [Pseudothermotoga thermarum]|uniref:DUF4897 domain-containing protein n=1 Tax=Pseudothermotoga thermarum DSM 5069 TaxID=688269 RepID=F7YWP6_9THEM|nr:DUF4897 domain-containing protein [Pseudothermotoga thermarum]AEH52036.1 hypothetical protein Theth_1997 [Pseudothermotoga thermarum DSM 5069]
MNQRTLFYILIAFVGFFIVFQFITIFTQKPPFEIVYYRTKMEYDYNGSAVFTTTAGLFFKDKNKQASYVQQYQQVSLDTFRKYFEDVSKKIGREIEVVSMESSINERAGILEIVEVAKLNNAAVVTDGVVDTQMKDITLSASGDSEIVIVIPKDAVVVSVEPTPTKIVENQIYWQPIGSRMAFPRVVFKRGE